MSVHTHTAARTRDLGIIAGLRVIAELTPDPSITDPRRWDDSIGDAEVRAWLDGDWEFVTVTVRAVDPGTGREAGSAAMGAFVCGRLPGAGEVSPLDDDADGFAHGYGAQLVAEALRDAGH